MHLWESGGYLELHDSIAYLVLVCKPITTPQDMKHLPITIIIVLSITSCISQSENQPLYFDGSFEETIKKATKEQKLIFLDFFTVWCGGCKSYDRFVFSDSTIKEYLKANFVFKSIDAEKEAGIELKNHFGVHAYPTLIIANNEGIEIGRIIGFKLEYGDNPNSFIMRVEDVVEGIGTLNTLEAEFDKNQNDPELILELIQAYEKHGKYKEMEDVAQKLLNAEDTLWRISGEYYYALSWIWRQNDPSPSFMKDFLSSEENQSTKYHGYALDRLLNYYKRRDQADSLMYYYEAMLSFDPDDWYHKLNYAIYLFENNLDIDKAKLIAREYSKQPYPYTTDHKQPLLMAYTFAYEGELQKGISLFSDWMLDFTSTFTIDDTYWGHFRYAEFANRYDVELKQALAYIKTAEEHSGNLQDKVLMGEILFKLDMKEEANDILEEALEMVTSEKTYAQINNLLVQYNP